MVQTSTKNIAKQAATIGGGLAAAFLPQYCSADIVTVGGDGGTGSSATLFNGDATNLGDVLASSIRLDSSRGSTAYLRGAGSLFSAVRSTVAASGNVSGSDWGFVSEGRAREGAELNSADNWVPGHFAVADVNDGELIFGWLQVELGSGEGFTATIISFSYEENATDTTAFQKPVGGFSVSTAVPEPSGFGLLALLAAGAGGLGRYRRA